MKTLLNSIDLNNSGSIDYTEFVVSALEKNILKKQHFEKAFAYFDIDHSGGITFTEIIQFL